MGFPGHILYGGRSKNAKMDEMKKTLFSTPLRAMKCFQFGSFLYTKIRRDQSNRFSALKPTEQFLRGPYWPKFDPNLSKMAKSEKI